MISTLSLVTYVVNERYKKMVVQIAAIVQNLKSAEYKTVVIRSKVIIIYRNVTQI
jgi:hypothetical protein